jgi:glycosyltransferase involved in cell wall biosynthesis
MAPTLFSQSPGSEATSAGSPTPNRLWCTSLIVTAVFSVIVPTYNRAGFVGRAIQGALEQRLPGDAEVEVIVVDDESTDNTPEVVATFGSRVRYVRQSNRREGAARNAGAALARGTYFAFLDSDDYWLPDKLARDLARFEQMDRPALVYSRGRNVDPADRVIGERQLPHPQGDVFWQLAREAFIPMSTVSVRADAFRACGGFVEDPNLSGTADWQLWIRLAARWPVGFVDQVATCIRVHERNMSADAEYMERAMLAGVRYALADPVVAERARGRERFIQASMYVTIALNAYGNRRHGRSWLWLSRAVATWPPQLVDTRFWGAFGRAAAGQTVLSAIKASPRSLGRRGARG